MANPIDPSSMPMNKQGAPSQPKPGNPGLLNGDTPGPEQKPSTSSAENQDQYDMFMAYAIKVIHNQKFSDHIVEVIKSLNGDMNAIIDFIANSTVGIVNRLESAAEDKGVVLADNVKANGALEVLAEISSFIEIAGGEPLTEEQLAQAYSLTVSTYLDEAVKSGKMTKEELAQASEMLQKGPEGQKFEKTRSEILAGSGKDAGQTQPAQPNQPSPGLIAPTGGM